jgi:hypothetical protein
MTELVHKRKNLTEEERKERSRIQNEHRKKELSEIKASKKQKVPYTKEEKEEKRRNKKIDEEQKAKERLIIQSPAIVLSEALEMIRRIGIEKVAGKTGISKGILTSWVYRIYQPQGKMSEILQEYLKSVRY